MLRDWTLRLRSLFRSRRVEQDLDVEMRFHFEHLVESHMRRGLARDDAVRRARLEFGGLDQIKEAHRDARGISVVTDLGRDVRHALRQIRRAPGFALLAVLCLGLGIGVNTAIFGVIDWVLLRPIAVDAPERLVLVSRGQTTSVPYPLYRELERRTRTLSGLTAAFPMESDLDVEGESAFAVAEVVPSDYAQVLGLDLSLGRWFVDDREPVAVISYAIWESRFGRSPDVIGHIIRSESQSYTIVGVAPRAFGGVFAPLRTDIWVPIQTRPRFAAELEKRGSRQLTILIGRLREGATPAQASAELNAIDAQVAAEQGTVEESRTPLVADPVRGLIANPSGRFLMERLLTMLAVVVGLVLLIACVNVGNLLLVRGALRQREFAVRRALGASRFRLLQQLLVETLVLALAGGLCGIVLAMWTSRLLEMSFPAVVGFFAMQFDLSLQWRTLLFATLVSIAATLACGLLPAWRTSRMSGLVAFKGEIGGGAPRRRPIGLVAQVVISLVLLFVAGSFLTALRQLQATDPGFTVAGRLYAYTSVPSPPFTPESRRDFYAQAVDRLRVLPGVQTVALTSVLPLMPGGSDCASLRDAPKIQATASAVDTGYFETMGIRLVAGRDFAVHDLSGGATTAVMMNEALAGRLWPDRPAVGEHVMLGCEATQPAVVIGVVSDSAIRGVGETPRPHLYRRFAPQHAGGLTTMLVATEGDAAGMVQLVRRTLLDLGQGIRVYAVQPLSVHVEQSYAKVRWIAAVLSSFGLLALVLAAVGLYGTIAYRVTLRTQEIGVRMALGARRTDVFREVLRHGLQIVLIGVAIGEVVTAALTGVAGAVQEGVGPSGVSMHLAIALIWIVVALAACYVPAARASRVDPLVALRHE